MNQGEVEARRVFAQALTEAREVAETPAAEDKLLPVGPGYVVAVTRFTVKLVRNDKNPDCRDLLENLKGRTIDEADITA